MPRQLTLCLTAVFMLCKPAHAQINGRAGIQVDNDVFSKMNPWTASDYEYTHGTILWAEFPGRNAVPRSAARLLGCDSTHPCRARVEIGQHIYTPRREADQPIPGERPHAGWLYASVAAVSDRPNAFTSLGLSVGISGPPSLAAEMQSVIHDAFGMREPRGWSNQLPAEATFQIRAHTSSALAMVQSESKAALIAYDAALDAGNVFTRADLGISGQVCFGSDDCRPGGVPNRTRFAVIIRGFTGSQFVARNMFLDGTLRDSHSVAKRPFVLRRAASVAVRVDRVIGGFELHKRSREYESERGSFTYGSLSLQYIW